MNTENIGKPTNEVFMLPASFAQQRLWLADQLNPGDPALNMAVAVRFRGQLDMRAVQASLTAIIQRHEVLRTRYGVHNGEIVQFVSQFQEIDLQIVEVSESITVEEICGRASVIAQESFDLVKGPVLRTVLMRIGPQDCVLVIVVHHIAADGWSMMVLVREFTEFYISFLERRPASLVPLAVQYGDYAQWQKRCFVAGKFQKDVIYWREKLSGISALDLPSDYLRPPVQRHNGARETRELSSEVSTALNQLASQQQTTLFIVLLAALKLLLHRYTGVCDITIGTPVAGRKRAEVDPLVGCFLNTLVMRTAVLEKTSFLELLGRVRETALEAYSHDDVPFEKVLEEVNPARELSHTPLFQVFLNMLRMPDAPSLSLPGVTAEILVLPESTAKFDLTLYVHDKPSRLAFSLVYNTELFSSRRMREMLQQFEYLLGQIVANPRQKIGEYSLVTPGAQLLLPDPQERLDGTWEGAVHELFQAHAARDPFQLATCDPDVMWSYQELDILSNQLAHLLLTKQVRTGDVVAIYAHRSAPLVLALLGVMKAGGAFLVLDPVYPAGRLIDYLEMAQPKAWLQLEAAGPVPEAIADFLAASACPQVIIPSGYRPDFASVFAGLPAAAPTIPVTAENLAYISFTSGSTGKPKGVLGGHGSLTHFVPWLVEAFGFNNSDRFSLFSALSHDPLHRDVFTPLMIGATVFVPPADEWRVPEKAREWIYQNDITVCHLTPAMGKLLTEDKQKTDYCLDSLKYIFFVGDALTYQDVLEISKLAPSATCVNFFGATETQRAVSFFPVPIAESSVDGESSARTKYIVPLGRGIKDVQLLVLNQERHLAGIGEAGEIYVRSPHLALGYLNDASLSAEKFVRNWFTNAADDRMYKTGDLGRYLPNGAVETLGRKDTQVKIRGFRIELGEIEALLKQQPRVSAAAVVSIENSTGVRQLAAYVVLDDEDAGWKQRLIRSVKEKLPDYMVPASFVLLKELPLTANGKLDRRALPVPDQGDLQESRSSLTMSPEEELLSNICSVVLKQTQVGIHSNFFEIGGHSLSAVQVIARIRETFAVDLPLRTLFEFPSVARLAERIRELRIRGIIADSAIVPCDQKQNLPLSYPQQRLWLMQQMEPESAEYNMFVALRLAGALDTQVLHSSLHEIVLRHAVLRTSFASTKSGPVQVIADYVDLEVPQTDLRSLPAEDRHGEVLKHARQEATQPFDLLHAPLLRARLLQTGDTEHVLLLSMHHIVGDGWSMAVLAREMRLLYEGRRSGEKQILPELTVQYADYAVWQHKWLRGEVLEKQLVYWRQQMKGAPTKLILPGELQDQREQRGRTAAGEQSIRVSRAVTTGLRQISRESGATLFMTLLTAWQMLLYRYSGQTEMVLGMDVAGRRMTELESLIGFFVNQLPLRTNLEGEPSFRELLGRVRSACVEAYAHQDVPFERIVEELNPKRQFGQIPWMQCKLVNMNMPRDRIEAEDLTIEPMSLGVSAARFDLTLFACEQDEQLLIVMQYRQERFSRNAVERLAQELEQLLSEVVRNPDLTITEERAAVKTGSGRRMLARENHFRATLQTNHSSS